MSVHEMKERMADDDLSSNYTHHAHTPKQPTRMGHGQTWTAHKKQVIGMDQKLAIFTTKLAEF